MADLMNQEYDHLFKVLLLGDSGTGKSSLILRYTEDTFNSSLVSSIGVDFKVKKKIIDGKIIRIQIVRNLKNIIVT
jgi:GTPase SAR1 family protein